LKDGKTAAALIKDATTDAFARAGYRVVESASAPTDIPVDVDILQFWAYNTGSWTFKFTAVIEAQLRSDVPAIAPDNHLRTTVSDQPPAIIEVMDTAIVSLERGFRRRIPRGSTWTLIGRSPEGQVFRPVDQVFTVEGEHVHEAYLVLDGDRVVGFYLPVERAFAPARGGTDTR